MKSLAIHGRILPTAAVVGCLLCSAITQAEPGPPFNPSANPFAATGAIEFEQYNVVTYPITSNPNAKKYRLDSVGIAACSVPEYGYALTSLPANLNLVYPLKVGLGGSYQVAMRIKGSTGNVTFRFDNAITGATVATIAGSASGAGWFKHTLGSVALPAQDYLVRVTFTSPAASAEFNYFEVNVAPPSITIPAYVNTIGFLYSYPPVNPNDVVSQANANRVTLQNAINDVAAHGGGTVRLPEGTFMFRQASPTENPIVAACGATPVWSNTAGNTVARINSSQIRIEGVSKTKTVLRTHNRDTTLFYVGAMANESATSPSGIVFSKLTLQGNPRVSPTGAADDLGLLRRLYGPPGANGVGGYGCDAWRTNEFPCVTQRPVNAGPGDGVHHEIGDLVDIHPMLGSVANVEFVDCAFINPPTRGIRFHGSHDIYIHQCDFKFFDGMDPSVSKELLAHVGVFGIGSYNVNVSGNTFDGNASWTTQAGPHYCADGLVWLTSGGNFVIADNVIRNYGLEGIQVNSGPSSIVRNSYSTLSREGGAVALNAYHVSTETGISSANSIYSAYCFVGNSVLGGGIGVHCSPADSLNLAPYDMFISGNQVYPAQVPNLFLNYCGTAYVYGSMGIATKNTRFASISGNRVIAVERGIDTSSGNYTAVPASQGVYRIFCNDLADNAGYGVYCMDEGHYVKELTVYGNKLGRRTVPTPQYQDTFWKHVVLQQDAAGSQKPYVPPTGPAVSVYGNTYYWTMAAGTAGTPAQFIWAYRPTPAQFRFIDRFGTQLTPPPPNAPVWGWVGYTPSATSVPNASPWTMLYESLIANLQ